jgi:hypothetical protein
MTSDQLEIGQIVWYKSTCVRCSRKATIIRINKKSLVIKFITGNLQRVNVSDILLQKP